ncbi:MAG: UDP-3-O-acyl-N-acetylglucosamine deacetylase [Pseudomonadota bacterium]
MSFYQRTVAQPVSCVGIGLHSGKRITLTIKPASPSTGIVFVRADLPGRPEIRAAVENVVDTRLATTIGRDGARVSTVEHLMAALAGMGIDNAQIDVDGAEIPIMDGSAAPFIFLLKSVGTRVQHAAKRFIVIRKPLALREGDKSLAIYPAREFKISCSIDFDHPLLREQHYSLSFSDSVFEREISRARTFGFLHEVEAMQKRGFALGGSLDNAVVVDRFRILNEDGLRYRDEFVRHKILDLVGDAALLGRPVIGHFIADKSGHALNNTFLRELLATPAAWDLFEPEVTRRSVRRGVRLPEYGLADVAAA